MPNDFGVHQRRNQRQRAVDLRRQRDHPDGRQRVQRQDLIQRRQPRKAS